MFFFLLGFLGVFLIGYMCRKNYLNLGEPVYIEVDKLNTPDSSDVDQGMDDNDPYSDTDEEEVSQNNDINERIENIKNSLNEPCDNISYPFDKEINEETNKDKNE
jgi:hypothetical protein